MTAMLACDGCGNIVQDRASDDDPTREWWSLQPWPVVGSGVAGMVSLSAVPFDPDAGLEMETIELPDPEPTRHFCSVACIATWAATAA